MTTPGIKLLKRPSIILFCGRPASGKTTAMVSVIRQIVEFKKPAFGKIYVSTKFSGDFTFAPDEDIFEDYTQEHLEAYVNKIKAWKKRNPQKDVPQNLLVIDDAMGQINWYSRFWLSLISTHRHWGMNILVATQSLTAGGHGSSTLLRNCVDMAVLYHSSFINTKKNLYLAFGGWFPSFKEFDAIFTKSTKENGDHWAMVYMANGSDLQSTYFAWKATVAKPFKIKW
jgi:hypothetical protein